jgi:hypothetical protein
MRRYSIVGQRHGERGEGTICECDSNPMPLAHIAAMKRIPLGVVGKRMRYVDKFSQVYVLDRESGKRVYVVSSAGAQGNATQFKSTAKESVMDMSKFTGS